jgi:signal transduction histidine kinase
MTAFDLTSVELFASLPGDDLARLQANLGERTLAAGEVLFHEGESADNAYIISDGEVEILKREGDRDARIAVSGVGVIVGEMALLADEPRNATARALSDVNLVVVPQKTFDDQINSSAEAMRAVFDVFLGRMRELELRVRQSERMAQIGVLTAGLAHEMNNPAAAVSRGAEQLGAALMGYSTLLHQLPANVDLPEPGEARAPLSALDRADREEDLETILERLGVADPWDKAASLVAAGVTREAIEGIAAGSDVAVVIEATAGRAEIVALLREVQEGAKRLSELVNALKSYSFLDQAPVQETDVIQGIEDTLLILKSKTKDIEIRREFAPDLPVITAYGSLLNQVWTNLIDNAADAIHSSGTGGSITIRARAEGDAVVVEVEDDGPGIPKDIVGHIFEAFFTTKEPGRGTGIGLNTVYNIVVNDHRGAIDVASAPGSTTFRVQLPVDQA